jgi:hypothetical protein
MTIQMDNTVGGCCCCRCYSRSIIARYPAATLVPVRTLDVGGPGREQEAQQHDV